jgi:glycosyltransferase involved in cell wall biosynthesis
VRDSNILAYKIIELLKNEKKLREFGDAGYLKYAGHFTWRKVAQKITQAIHGKM